MYQELTSDDVKMMNEIENVTLTDYGRSGILFPSEKHLIVERDLLNEIYHLREELKNSERDKRENYRPIPLSKFYGVSIYD